MYNFSLVALYLPWKELLKNTRSYFKDIFNTDYYEITFIQIFP